MAKIKVALSLFFQDLQNGIQPTVKALRKDNLKMNALSKFYNYQIQMSRAGYCAKIK